MVQGIWPPVKGLINCKKSRHTLCIWLRQVEESGSAEKPEANVLQKHHMRNQRIDNLSITFEATFLEEFGIKCVYFLVLNTTNIHNVVEMIIFGVSA